MVGSGCLNPVSVFRCYILIAKSTGLSRMPGTHAPLTCFQNNPRKRNYRQPCQQMVVVDIKNLIWTTDGCLLFKK